MNNKTYLRTTALALVLASSGAAALAQELLVPAYFYPSSNPALSYWDELTAAAQSGVRITAIMNPSSGPGAAVNSDYVAAVNSFRAAGGKVLGYVYTCYGNNSCFSGLPATRTTAEVLADAAKYATWYNVDGIFLDEMSNTASALPFYETVAAGLRTARPSASIFGNPGVATPASYLAVADTLVTFEDGGGYGSAAAPSWGLTQASGRQAHLHHSISTEAGMLAALAEARARNAGYVYITDDVLDNPWDRLPSYWNAELAALAPVPEPTPLALMVAGLLALRLRGARLHKTQANKTQPQ
jgi:Spherulation-specific family 4